MADLSQTPANVARGGSDTDRITVQVGEAVTQGQPVYRKASDNKYYRAAADTLAEAAAVGIVLTPAATNGSAEVAIDGHVNLGATLTVGQVYVVSTTVGGIAPYADLGAGDFVTSLGIATTTALLDLQPHVSNTAKP